MHRATLIGVLLLLVAGCTTLQVTSEFNPKTDFTRLKTYAWLDGAEKRGNDVRIDSELVTTAVRQSVEDVLAARGLKKVEAATADCLVTWFGAIEQRLTVENIDHFYARYGYGALYRSPQWNPQSTGQAVDYEEGSLVIDIIDSTTHSLLWRGSGRDKIVAGRPETQVRANIKAAVNRILAELPSR